MTFERSYDWAKKNDRRMSRVTPRGMTDTMLLGLNSKYPHAMRDASLRVQFRSEPGAGRGEKEEAEMRKQERRERELMDAEDRRRQQMEAGPATSSLSNSDVYDETADNIRCI